MSVVTLRFNNPYTREAIDIEAIVAFIIRGFGLRIASNAAQADIDRAYDEIDATGSTVTITGQFSSAALLDKALETFSNDLMGWEGRKVSQSSAEFKRTMEWCNRNVVGLN